MPQMNCPSKNHNYVEKISVRHFLLLLLALSLFVSGCDNSRTIWSNQVKSPDGRWTATAHSVEHRGPGNNDLETMVYLKPKARKVVEILGFFHDPTLLSNTINLEMRWATPERLEVTYTNHPKLYLQKSRVDDVEIIATEKAEP
jgi:hypothetical protein